MRQELLLAAAYLSATALFMLFVVAARDLVTLLIKKLQEKAGSLKHE